MENCSEFNLKRAVGGMMADLLEWTLLIMDCYKNEPEKAQKAIRDMVKNYRGEHKNGN